MKKKIYINPKCYEEMRARHRGEYHPTETVKGDRPARLWVQADIAQLIHISKERLSIVKTGREAVSRETVESLAEIWGTTFNQLTGLDSTPEALEKQRLSNYIKTLNELVQYLNKKMEEL